MIWRVSAKYEEKKSAHMKSIWVFHLKFLRWVKKWQQDVFSIFATFWTKSDTSHAYFNFLYKTKMGENSKF